MINIQRLLRLNQRMQLEISRRNMYILNPKTTCALSNDNRQMTKSSTRSMSFIQSETMRKFLTSIPFLGFSVTKIKANAYKHFENVVDKIDYIEFFEEFDLPDTFYSWFVVTELHLWMLSARAMAEGRDGRLVRNTLVEALWADVLQRVKKLDTKGNPIDIRTKIVELSEQLQAAYISYDEGLLGEDIVLAGALWRRFYQQSEVDVEHLEKLVKYVRKNMRGLENLNADDFYDSKNVKWCSITT